MTFISKLEDHQFPWPTAARSFPCAIPRDGTDPSVVPPWGFRHGLSQEHDIEDTIQQDSLAVDLRNSFNLDPGTPSRGSSPPFLPDTFAGLSPESHCAVDSIDRGFGVIPADQL